MVLNIDMLIRNFKKRLAHMERIKVAERVKKRVRVGEGGVVHGSRRRHHVRSKRSRVSEE